MCTAVVGGLIHRTTTRSRTATDQTSSAPTISDRTKDRRKQFRSWVLVRAAGCAITFQNRTWTGLPANDSCCARDCGTLSGIGIFPRVRNRVQPWLFPAWPLDYFPVQN